MIDDSDVFAVTIDPRDANHLVASACSGIYESQNGGERWAKMNGIPSDSRRTYAIIQHPTIPGTIYAATNQGFWMSTNGGKSWMMTTSRDLMVTSIAVSPEAPNRVFIGTSNFGVMISDDGGKNWRQSNTNFTSRFTYSIDADSQQANRLYALTPQCRRIERRLILYKRRRRHKLDRVANARQQPRRAVCDAPGPHGS